MSRKDGESPVRVEPSRVVGHDWESVVPGGKQDVEQPAGPRPVGRGPEPVARLGSEVVRELHAGKMPQDHAVGVQCALRRAGSAGCIDEERRVIGSGRDP